MIKKITNYFLLFAILFNIVMPMGAANAAAPKAVLNITVPATALRGQEVFATFTVDVKANSHIGGITANFGYSAGFPEIISDETKTKITQNTLGWGSGSGYSMSTINEHGFIGLGEEKTDGGIISGQVAFTIPENADFGTIYTISITDIIIGDPDANELSASEYSVTNASASVEVVDLPRVEGISVQEYSGVYDGDEHTISVDIPEGATIKYSADGADYSLDAPPVFVNAGEHKAYYVVRKEGNSDTYGFGNVSISKKPLSDGMIDPISPQQYTGSQITPSITVTDGSPSIITENDYTISYGDNVNVTAGGSVTITGCGNYTGTAVASFDILPLTMEVEETDYEDVYDGDFHSAQVSVTKPSNATIAFGTVEGTYDLSTMPEYKDAGTYTVFYKATAENYEDYTGSVKVIITPKEITEDMIADIPSYDYTGSQITPSVTVNDGNTDLIIERDYTVSYGDNINVADSGSVTVEGIGNYKSSAQKTFVINPIPMTVSTSDYSGVYDGEYHSGAVNVEIPDTATVTYGTTEENCSDSVMPNYKDVGTYTVYYKATDPNYIENKGSFQVNITPKTIAESMIADIPDMPYTGEQITPAVQVTDGDPSIIFDTDYTVSYGTNVNVADGGSVILEGCGNYEGTATKYFNITPIPMTVSTVDFEGIFDGDNHSATVTVTEPSNAVVMYGLTEGTYDLDTMPSFKNADEYTVFYKATAENYIDNTGSVNVTINPKAVTVDMISDINSYAYTGSQIIPDFTVADGDVDLIFESDYTVTYGENINVSDGGSVTITGCGNYEGTATKNFAITPIDMAYNAVGYQGVYDGTNHSVSITVTEPVSAQIMYGTEEGTYNLETAPEYKNAGNNLVYYKIIADNYNDVTGVLNVDIAKKDLTEEMLENITAQEYTGSQITPSVTLRDTLPCEITSSDYIVSYGENITVAEGGSVTVTGQGNYTGTITKTFEIANAVLRTEEADYEGIYDGTPHSASVTVTNSDAANILYGLAEGNYDLSEMPVFTDAGNYVVYYKATAENYSDCTGSVDVVIAPKTLTETMVGNLSSYTYTSQQITPVVSVTDGDPSIITAEDYDVVYGENINVTSGGSVTVNAKRNYTGTVSKTFEITKAELSITSESKEITYGDAFEIPVNYTGFVGSETKENLISEAVATGFDASPNVGTYDIILGGAQSDNYNITYGTDYTLTVNKKNITLTNLNVFDKAYDETTAAVINETTAVLEGVLSGDVVILDLSSATANFASAEVGDGISVSIEGLALAGEDGNNYALTDTTFTTSASIMATITSADIAAQITSIVIDKNTSSLVLPTVPEGFVITLKSSSDETIVGLNGVIYTDDADRNVDLVFTVSNEEGTDLADTATITATVPAHDKYQVTVTAESNGAVSGGGMYVKNTSATINATPNSGYKFDGWYNGNVLVSSAASYTFTVTENVSLVAKFSVAYSGGGGGSTTKYTVNFVTNGGSRVDSITVKKNGTIATLPTPEKEGFVFAGWYTDSAFTKPFDSNSAITNRITLYAKWEEKPVEPEKPDEPEKPADEITFTDVKESAWYYDAVKYVTEKGLFNGVSETDFAPESHLTRAMLVTVLYRAENQPEVNDAQSFADVNAGEYYSKAVIWASKNGIVSGVSDNEFMPDNNITREQIAAIIYRYAKYKGIVNQEVSEIDYQDKGQISDWAADAIAFCKGMKIMTGTNTNEFMPRANATRAEVAATLQRFFETK